jgi:hypothetical protein
VLPRVGIGVFATVVVSVEVFFESAEVVSEGYLSEAVVVSVGVYFELVEIVLEEELGEVVAVSVEVCFILVPPGLAVGVASGVHIGLFDPGTRMHTIPLLVAVKTVIFETG